MNGVKTFPPFVGKITQSPLLYATDGPVWAIGAVAHLSDELLDDPHVPSTGKSVAIVGRHMATDLDAPAEMALVVLVHPAVAITLAIAQLFAVCRTLNTLALFLRKFWEVFAVIDGITGWRVFQRLISPVRGQILPILANRLVKLLQVLLNEMLVDVLDQHWTLGTQLA